MNQLFKFQLSSHCIYCHISLYIFCQQVFNLYTQQAVKKGFNVFFRNPRKEMLPENTKVPRGSQMETDMKG